MAAKRSPKARSESMARPLSPARARLTRYAEEHEIDLIFFDPPEHFDDAILGIIYGFNQEPAVLYDEAKVLSAMVADGMSEEDAEEYFAFNTIGGWVGDATPRFLIVRPDDDA
jgi:hypothetical protein